MKKTFFLNPFVSYREKNGTFVFYNDFKFIFFTGIAAGYVKKLLKILDDGGAVKDLPNSFLEYLVSKNIIWEKGHERI